MSQAALDYVRDSEAVKGLPASEKMVLEKLAMLHKLEVHCAFASIPDITRLCLIGGKDAQRQCRRILERLEKKGFIVRHKSIRNNGSQTSNEYELLGLRAGTAVTEQMRQQVFTTPRTRVAAQLNLMLGNGAVVDGKEDDANGSDSSAVASCADSESEDESNRGVSPAVERERPNGSEGSAVASDVDEAPNRSESLAVDKNHQVSASPRTPRCPPPPGQPRVSALDVVLEASKEVILPLNPSSPTESAKSANQEQERRATASATAAATTSKVRAVQAATECGGETGMSLGGRVSPFRRERDPEKLRARLDGEEAAMFDEVMRVLGAFGLGPGSVRRRMRVAAEDALLECMQLEECCLGDAGDYLVERREAYLQVGPMLTGIVEARRFLAEGFWKDDRVWNLSLAAKEMHRRFSSARRRK